MLAINAVGAVVLALACRRDSDFADADNLQPVLDGWKPIDQVGLNDGASSTAHHRQVHHQTEGVPVDQVCGRAVVGAGEIFRLFNPGGPADPQPAP